MTVLVEPPSITMTEPHPAEPTTDLPRQRPPAGSWPLRVTDPVSVDGHRLIARLGSGGMADVFYAWAPAGEPVVVKLLRPASGAAEACQREYRLASTVDPHCTAPVFGHGTSTAGAYLVTAHLPGYRCGSTLVGKPTPASLLWSLGAALARTLAAVHARGVVHCDVKPSNLLVRDHDVRIIDFGIARHIGQRCGDDGIVQCSRGWAAPEQLRTAPATPAVDVFAWGCLLAHLAAGVHPFASRSEQEWILRLQSAQPDLHGLPPHLNDLVRRTLTRDPRHRPSAAELATICGTHADGQPQPVPDHGAHKPLHHNPRPRTSRRPRRRSGWPTQVRSTAFVYTVNGHGELGLQGAIDR
ncbi:serine/threonine-protein kinase [Phytohabitans sp. LJ34]|uniref:serine/threonine-protein kinase n=1 Tax=Phytohabitans sp. LJ34 TaxID=3452217 RepID=UPI003F896543